jgi:hypothetical protein
VLGDFGQEVERIEQWENQIAKHAEREILLEPNRDRYLSHDKNGAQAQVQG